MLALAQPQMQAQARALSRLLARALSPCHRGSARLWQWGYGMTAGETESDADPEECAMSCPQD